MAVKETKRTPWWRGFLWGCNVASVEGIAWCPICEIAFHKVLCVHAILIFSLCEVYSNICWVLIYSTLCGFNLTIAVFFSFHNHNSFNNIRHCEPSSQPENCQVVSVKTICCMLFRIIILPSTWEHCSVVWRYFAHAVIYMRIYWGCCLVIRWKLLVVSFVFQHTSQKF